MLKKSKREWIELQDKLEDLKTQMKFLRGGREGEEGLAKGAVLEGMGGTPKAQCSGMMSSQILLDLTFPFPNLSKEKRLGQLKWSVE